VTIASSSRRPTSEAHHQPLPAHQLPLLPVNSGLTWIKQTHVRSLFEQLRGHGRVTHELLDSLPPSRTRDYVRGLLVEHSALPGHDLYRDRFNEWTPDAIDRLDHPDDRDVITRVIRRHILGRMNEEGATSRGTFLRAKQTVTVAIDFLTGSAHVTSF
jgi:hypothetical protein